MPLPPDTWIINKPNLFAPIPVGKRRSISAYQPAVGEQTRTSPASSPSSRAPTLPMWTALWSPWMEGFLDAEWKLRVSPIVDVHAKRLGSGFDADDLDGSNHTLLVELEDAEGVVGIGEADTSSAAALAVVTMDDEQRWNSGLRSTLLGSDPFQIGALWDRLAAATAYQGPSGISRHALAGVDIALHDLAGKQLGRPSFHLLGGARRDALTAVPRPSTPDRSGIGHCPRCSMRRSCSWTGP